MNNENNIECVLRSLVPKECRMVDGRLKGGLIGCKMSNIETLTNTMIPHMIKYAILVGIIVCLISVTIAAYSYLRKKQSLKEIMTYLSYAFGIGVMIILSGFIVNFIANYDISFSSFKHYIPVGYIVSLVIFLLLAKITNKTN